MGSGVQKYRLIAETAIDQGACQKVWELAEFLDLLAGLSPEVVVEIGSHAGGTLYAWSRIAPTVIGMDVCESEMILPHTGKPRGEHGAHMVIGDTHMESTRDELIDYLDGRFIDCLFIDGDHSYDGVRQDYEMYRDLVRPGGLIAFHDIVTHQYQLGCEVVKLWTEIRDESAVEIIDSDGDHWGGIGVLTRG
jgi:predicted O-methyltransferase YrrM